MLTLHKASAGSGKTYTLTYHYIKLLLGRKDAGAHYSLAPDRNRHRAILAITFTNKATDEMKRRIVEQLAALAGITGRTSDYATRLCDELGCTVDELRKRACSALTALLADFTNFNISTIDSFFQTVLRTFAREAELSGNYEVELDDRRAVAVGVSDMLSSINRLSNRELMGDPGKRALVSWLTRYMKSRIDEGKAFNVFNRRSSLTGEIVTFVQNALSEAYKLRAEAIDGYLSDPDRIVRFIGAINEARNQRTKAFTAYATEAWRGITAAGVDSGMKKHLVNNFDNWTSGMFKITPFVYKCVASPDERYKKNFSPDTAGDALVTEVLEAAIALSGDLTLYDRLGAEIYKLGLIGEVNRQIDALQAENNSILLRDTNDILRRIISDEEAPFIYERLGVRLRHFLIDEFQDTSRLQWANLSALVRESLATGNDNLIIGDEKQSIYRFRNSDADLLIHDVPRDFVDQIDLHGNIPAENTNWRSAREIVRFNNTVFRTIASAVGLDDIYGNVVQRIARRNLSGYVSARPYTEPEEALDNMVAEIKRELASGFSQRDITVLVAAHREGELVIDHLLRVKQDDPELAGLQLMSEDSLIVGHAPSVQLVVSVMRYVDKARSRGGATDAATERASVEQINKRFRYYLANGRDKVDALAMAFADDGVIDALVDDAINMDCISIPSFVERIIARCVSAESHRVENVYLCAFQDMVSDFCARPDADLHSFVKWWDETGSARSLDTPSDVDALRVMTIHKSKGLEFPCVHIPFVDWSLDRGGQLMWFDLRDNLLWDPFADAAFNREDIPPLFPLSMASALESTALGKQYAEYRRKEWIDTMNRAYVAFTRARRELIIGYEADSRFGELLTGSVLRADEAYCATLSPDDDTLAPLSGCISDDGVITFGEPVTGYETARRSDTSVAMPDYFTYDNEHIWSMSRIEDLEEMARPRRQGIVLHSVMSDLRTAADIDKAVINAVTRGNLDETEAASTRDFLARALALPQVRQWFEGYRRLLTERSFTVNKNGVAEHYRPDRVVWTAGGTIDVVDYKFGREEPARYKRQISRYVRAVRAMYTGVRVRGFLWYPLEGVIDEVRV